jgi:hypothetical protein
MNETFSCNQTAANEVVNLIATEIGQQMDDQKRTTITSSNTVNVTNLVQSTRQIRGKVGECVSFLFHLQSCMANMSTGDVELTLQAALMALKPNGTNSSQAYEQISSMIQELKTILIKKT